ncbi:MAG: F0F1 ATP synthase subunit A [Planctomycetota bacterium]
MTPFLLPVASSDPLEHIFDHPLLKVGGMPVITMHVVMLWVAAALCLLLFPVIVRRIARDGTGGRLATFFEAILLFIRDEMARPFMGKDGDRFLPIIWTFFFFILFCNLLGMIPGSATATGNISVTAGLAAVSFVTYHSIGIAHNGFFGYLKANLLVGPPFLWPLMIIVELAGHAIRPCALCIRLFANMVAGHTMLAVIIGFALALRWDNLLAGSGIALVSVVSAVLLNFLELLVAMIQAFIFTFLTTVFLSMAVHPEH